MFKFVIYNTHAHNSKKEIKTLNTEKRPTLKHNSNLQIVQPNYFHPVHKQKGVNSWGLNFTCPCKSRIFIFFTAKSFKSFYQQLLSLSPSLAAVFKIKCFCLTVTHKNYHQCVTIKWRFYERDDFKETISAVKWFTREKPGASRPFDRITNQPTIILTRTLSLTLNLHHLRPSMCWRGRRGIYTHRIIWLVLQWDRRSHFNTYRNC